MSIRDDNKAPSTDADYVEIVQSNVKVDRTFVDDEGQPAKITYYCRKCKKPVSVERMGKKLSFKCGECGEENIPFGSEDSVSNYYKKFRGEDE